MLALKVRQIVTFIIADIQELVKMNACQVSVCEVVLKYSVTSKTR